MSKKNQQEQVPMSNLACLHLEKYFTNSVGIASESMPLMHECRLTREMCLVFHDLLWIRFLLCWRASAFIVLGHNRRNLQVLVTSYLEPLECLHILWPFLRSNVALRFR